MTIRYKSDTFDLTTTNVTTVLTCPSDATIIVKSLQASHRAATDVLVDAFLRKSGGSDVEISFATLNESFENFVSASLNMEADDILKVQANTSNVVTGYNGRENKRIKNKKCSQEVLQKYRWKCCTGMFQKHYLIKCRSVLLFQVKFH
jgi:hypothetical protein